MTLLSCQNICKTFGGRNLFSSLSFGVFLGDKIGLIGPNGSGKSTLLKIIAGIEKPDEGIVVRNRFLRVGYVSQETTFAPLSIENILLDALKNDPPIPEEEKQTKVFTILSKMGFTNPSTIASTLSGGWKKRLAIAAELINSPDILLLDEPTNHLDLEGVIWLEKFLKSASFAFIVISHDRYFLENISTKMMELDKSYPKGLLATDGSYHSFLEKREEFLTGQIQQERSLSSKVRREVEWLKQNPKARTTKSQSRIRDAERLIEELQEIKTRNKTDRTTIDFSKSKQESKKLISVTNVSKIMGERLLFSGVNLLVTPGMRLGIVGMNGSGKTTFLRLLADELTPDKGTIKFADGVKILYFDQNRAQLPADITLRRALSPEGDTVNYRGQTIHVNAWCKRFLFSPDRLDLPFVYLSGGEKARVHIARLMLQPADVLLLDEPTNDLDIPTLEILETSLQEFPGAIILISHDRYMLDQISNVILGLGTNSDTQLFADYRQWEQFQINCSGLEKTKPNERDERRESPLEQSVPNKKLSYSERRELEQIEGKILSLEEAIAVLNSDIENPLYVENPKKMQQICLDLDKNQKALDALFARWELLEKKLK